MNENYIIHEEEEPHRLSFGDLPTLQSTLQSPKTPSARPDLTFAFSGADAAAPAAAHAYFSDIIFCGKIIHDDEEEYDHDNGLNEYQKRDYFATVKSQSLRKPYDHNFDNRRFSASSRGDLARSNFSDLDYHAQRVNITSLTSMSAKSKRRMFMFGMVKFKPEMELSAIKKRQGKKAAAESGGGKGERRGFRSLGCIPVGGGGGERRFGAAN